MDRELGIFVVTFPLKTTQKDEIFLLKRFRLAEQLYNRLWKKKISQYNELIKTNAYRAQQNSIIEKYKQIDALKKMDKPDKDEIKKLKEEIKNIYADRNQKLRTLHFTKFGFLNDMTVLRQPFAKELDSGICQVLAENLWAAFDKQIYHGSTRVRKKRFDSMATLRGKTNKSGIVYRDGCIRWMKHYFPVSVDYNNTYEVESFDHEIAMCGIKRVWWKGRWKYYAQIYFRGLPPAKRKKSDGAFSRTLGKGNCKVECELDRIYVITNGNREIYKLCPHIFSINQQIAEISRKMDRSRRSMNPENYNEDGTIRRRKPGEERYWKRSNHYLQMKSEFRQLHQKLANVRKTDHETLANVILRYGDNFEIHMPNFKKKQEKNGGHEGKQILAYSPAMFVEILNRKVKMLGGECTIIKESKNEEV